MMKTIIQKCSKSYLMIPVLLTLMPACNQDQFEVEPIEPITITTASVMEKQIFNNWFTKINKFIGIKGEYNPDNLLKITDNVEKISIFFTPNETNPSETISFNLDSKGNVGFAFKGKSVLYDDRIMNEIFSIEGELILTYIDYFDGKREIISVNLENARILSWWSGFEDCMGKFNAPSKSNVANIVFGVITSAVTLGLYIPLSALVCAAVAST